MGVDAAAPPPHISLPLLYIHIYIYIYIYSGLQQRLHAAPQRDPDPPVEYHDRLRLLRRLLGGQIMVKSGQNSGQNKKIVVVQTEKGARVPVGRRRSGSGQYTSQKTTAMKLVKKLVKMVRPIFWSNSRQHPAQSAAGRRPPSHPTTSTATPDHKSAQRAVRGSEVAVEVSSRLSRKLV